MWETFSFLKKPFIVIQFASTNEMDFLSLTICIKLTLPTFFNVIKAFQIKIELTFSSKLFSWLIDAVFAFLISPNQFLSVQFKFLVFQICALNHIHFALVLTLKILRHTVYLNLMYPYPSHRFLIQGMIHFLGQQTQELENRLDPYCII